MKIYRTAEGDVFEDGNGMRAASEGLLESLFASQKGEVGSILTEKIGEKAADELGQLLAPIPKDTEIWAAGVTYLRSKSARMEESEEAGG
ncbi:hypothetical protein N9139_01120, partial [Akkermansiaceae bacterium]|nr:hypothetical protein [Akkermansiaceae bacterium]